jgi:hypothetical protein
VLQKSVWSAESEGLEAMAALLMRTGVCDGLVVLGLLVMGGKLTVESSISLFDIIETCSNTIVAGHVKGDWL